MFDLEVPRFHSIILLLQNRIKLTMILRSTWILLLAASASAFVISPASVGRDRVGVSPIFSSLSDADTETNQESGSDTPLETVAVEPVTSDDSTEAAASPEEKTTAPVGQSPPVRYTVYIGNLPFTTTVQEIRDLCREHVEVRFVNLPKNRETNNIKGFAFVDVGSEDEVPKLVDALGGKEIGGRPLRVSRSLEKDQIRSTRKSVEGGKKLYVGNISFQSSKEDLGEYFGQYGEVKDVFIPVNKFGDSRGFCFITVKDEDVETVIEATNGGEFMGRPLAVNHPLPPGEKPQKREKPGRMKIFIGNLSFHTSDGTLSEVFSEFGEVNDCYIPRDIDSNNSRGFGFVTMARAAGGDAIDALDGCELDGRIISVNEAKPRESVKPADTDDENAPEGEDGEEFTP